MMNSLFNNINDISRAIELALTPVFLLTAIAGMLNVMTGRLSRIIDRGRTLTEHRLASGHPPTEEIVEELHHLERRRHFTSIAITSCTISALFVCLVIAVLFLEVLFRADWKFIVGLLFAGATMALVVGLMYFLREVHRATITIRIRKPALNSGGDA